MEKQDKVEYAVLSASLGRNNLTSIGMARNHHSRHPITFILLSSNIGDRPSKVTVVQFNMVDAFLLAVNRTAKVIKPVLLLLMATSAVLIIFTYIYIRNSFEFSMCFNESRSFANENLFNTSSWKFDLRYVLVTHIVIRIRSFELSHLLKSIVCLSSPILRRNPADIRVILRSLRSIPLSIVGRSNRLGLVSWWTTRTSPIYSLTSIVEPGMKHRT